MTHPLDLETLAVRAGWDPSEVQEHSEPLYLTSSFVFANAAEAAARFRDEVPGNIYSRFTNPTVQTFETRLAALEGAEDCVATASGMSACLTAFMGLLKAGDHVLASSALFGSTVTLLSKILSRFAIAVDFVPLADVDAWRAAIKENTRALFLETPSNPLMEIGDIARLAELAHAHEALLMVDNCFATPMLQRPLEHGADVVIHSATKYIDGHGRCLGGAVLGARKLMEGPRAFVRSAGPSMSPFNAWVFLSGLETLPLRMAQHSRSAARIATWLAAETEAVRVYYPGLASHPGHVLAEKQQKDYGGIVAFELAGGRERAWRFVDALQRFSLTANFGDAKSTVTHPASTTHGRLTPEQRAAAGIGEGLIRLSIGLESANDLQEDLAQAMQVIGRA